ncbi:MAG: hypothetical protein IJH61_06725 [Eubacteriaceae bacterium]|nr:hypothetical protein [Eubacteriaceae bacterium]
MSVLDAIKEAEALAEEKRKDAARQAREIIKQAEDRVNADREAKLSELREAGALRLEQAKNDINAAAARAIAEAKAKDDELVKAAEKHFDEAIDLIMERTKRS